MAPFKLPLVATLWRDAYRKSDVVGWSSTVKGPGDAKRSQRV